MVNGILLSSASRPLFWLDIKLHLPSCSQQRLLWPGLNFKSSRLNEFFYQTGCSFHFARRIKAESALTSYIQNNYAIPKLARHMPFLKFTQRIWPSPKENGE